MWEMICSFFSLLTTIAIAISIGVKVAWQNIVWSSMWKMLSRAQQEALG